MGGRAPFLTLIALATDIEHFEVFVVDLERSLHDTGCPDTSVQHMLVLGNIVGLHQLVGDVEEEFAAIHQLEFGPVVEAVLNGLLRPQQLHALHQLHTSKTKAEVKEHQNNQRRRKSNVSHLRVQIRIIWHSQNDFLRVLKSGISREHAIWNAERVARFQQRLHRNDNVIVNDLCVLLALLLLVSSGRENQGDR